MNEDHPLYGKRDSEITDEELMHLSEEEYGQYINWRLQINMKYLEDEGFVISSLDPNTREKIYLNASLDKWPERIKYK